MDDSLNVDDLLGTELGEDVDVLVEGAAFHAFKVFGLDVDWEDGLSCMDTVEGAVTEGVVFLGLPKKLPKR